MGGGVFIYLVNDNVWVHFDLGTELGWLAAGLLGVTGRF